MTKEDWRWKIANSKRETEICRAEYVKGCEVRELADLFGKRDHPIVGDLGGDSWNGEAKIVRTAYEKLFEVWELTYFCWQRGPGRTIGQL